MKKLFVLVAVLALVAAMVVPMAALANAPDAENVVLSGQVQPNPSVLTWQAPGNFSSWGTTWTGAEHTGSLNVGNNYATAPSGNVHFVQGNDGMTGWKLVITMGAGYSSGQMYSYDANPPGFLPSPLQISTDGGGNLQNVANFQGNTTTGSTDATFTLQAEQTVGPTDKAGVYGFTLVYTLTATP